MVREDDGKDKRGPSPAARPLHDRLAPTHVSAPALGRDWSHSGHAASKLGSSTSFRVHLTEVMRFVLLLVVVVQQVNDDDGRQMLCWEHTRQCARIQCPPPTTTKRRPSAAAVAPRSNSHGGGGDDGIIISSLPAEEQQKSSSKTRTCPSGSASRCGSAPTLELPPSAR
jgi:hypothetical protein